MSKDINPKNHLSNNMYAYPGIAKQVMTTEQVQETLLATDNSVFACGYMWALKVKDIGAGMKEITLVKPDL